MIRNPNSWFVRGPVLIVAASLFTAIVLVLAGGHIEYKNWPGQYVFAPVALLLLGYVVYAALFNPRALFRNSDSSRRRR